MDIVRAVLIAAAGAALAGPAMAQPSQFDIDYLRTQQEAAQRRAVDLANQLAAAENQSRADQAVLTLQLQQRLPPTVPIPPYPLAPRQAGAAPSPYPQIPDAALAASNQRVQAAEQNRR
jgi:hypothetical protein